MKDQGQRLTRAPVLLMEQGLSGSGFVSDSLEGKQGRTQGEGLDTTIPNWTMWRVRSHDLVISLILFSNMLYMFFASFEVSVRILYLT